MYQVVDMTHQEKVEMYMNLPKKKIVEMLIQCNLELERSLGCLMDRVVLANKDKLDKFYEDPFLTGEVEWRIQR